MPLRTFIGTPWKLIGLHGILLFCVCVQMEKSPIGISFKIQPTQLVIQMGITTYLILCLRYDGSPSYIHHFHLNIAGSVFFPRGLSFSFSYSNFKSMMNVLRMLKRWKVTITVAIRKLFYPLAVLWQLHLFDSFHLRTQSRWRMTQ